MGVRLRSRRSRVLKKTIIEVVINDVVNYVRIKAANGEILLTSESYDTEYNAYRAADTLKKRFLRAEVVITK